MAGYHGYSKSNNAVEAEQDSMFPISIAAKKTGIPSDLIALHVSPSEWHHTSGWFNQTDYFDLEEIANFFQADEGKAALAEFKKARKTNVSASVYLDCRVEWLDWGGSRNHPTCTKKTALAATVSVKGKTATITLKGGVEFKKRLSTNGFCYTPEWTAVEKKRKAKERESKKRLAAIIKRFKAFAKGKRFLSCDYFHYRDVAGRDIQKTTFTAITHNSIVAELKRCGEHYALRTVERCEMGEREVVRVGMLLGVRTKT